jgi:hypothetical protein
MLDHKTVAQGHVLVQCVRVRQLVAVHIRLAHSEFTRALRAQVQTQRRICDVDEENA